jgi:hypothetical protein
MDEPSSKIVQDGEPILRKVAIPDSTGIPRKHRRVAGAAVVGFCRFL